LHVLYGEDSPASKTVSVCQNPFEFRSLLHVAGQPHLVTQYPAGMAAKLKGSVGLRLQAHYLNTASADYTANVVVRLTKVDPATVTKWVAQLYFNRTVLSVPPGNNQQVSTTCTVPSTYGPISLISGASHMHSRGIHYVANTSAGTKLVDTTEWDEPPIVAYDPPIGLNPGDSITWTCTYDNQTGGTLNFGDSAQKNEMCIFLARFYSAPSGDDIECQSATASRAGQVTNNVAPCGQPRLRRTVRGATGGRASVSGRQSRRSVLRSVARAMASGSNSYPSSRAMRSFTACCTGFCS